MIIGIVAIANSYAIGKDGKLPWHYPADLKHFKATTSGQALAMGTNTWRSLGKHGKRGIGNRPSVRCARYWIALATTPTLAICLPRLSCTRGNPSKRFWKSPPR